MEIIPITFDELFKRYAAGERDFTQFQIRYTHTYTVRGNITVPHRIDLKGINLSGATFGVRAFEYINPLDGIDLSGANLIGAWLNELSINEANLSGANLSGAKFFQSSLRGTDLRGADFREADLADAILWNARVDGADFRGADLRQTWWDGTRLTNVNFKGAIASSFRGAIFDNTIMPDGTVRNN